MNYIMPSDDTRNDNINVYVNSERIYLEIFGHCAPVNPRATRPDFSARWISTRQENLDNRTIAR